MKTFHVTFFNLPDAVASTAFPSWGAAPDKKPLMRIAKPLLLGMTPIGVAWGLLEAWRFHWWLAVLMAALVGIISLFTWFTLRRIRADRARDS